MPVTEIKYVLSPNIKHKVITHLSGIYAHEEKEMLHAKQLVEGPTWAKETRSAADVSDRCVPHTAWSIAFMRVPARGEARWF